jgi:sulfide:quinone oxidoreductase
MLILGGGVGGVATARALRRRVPRTHRIVLVDREREHLFAPSLLWLMVGRRTAESIRRPLARLERRGIEVRFGEVERIDPERRVVTVGGETLSADFLVIALGAELDSPRCYSKNGGCTGGCSRRHGLTRRIGAHVMARAPAARGCGVP